MEEFEAEGEGKWTFRAAGCGKDDGWISYGDRYHPGLAHGNGIMLHDDLWMILREQQCCQQRKLCPPL